MTLCFTFYVLPKMSVSGELTLTLNLLYGVSQYGSKAKISTTASVRGIPHT